VKFRTSSHVAPTPLGERSLAGPRSAYDGLSGPCGVHCGWAAPSGGDAAARARRLPRTGGV